MKIFVENETSVEGFSDSEEPVDLIRVNELKSVGASSKGEWKASSRESH